MEKSYNICSLEDECEAVIGEMEELYSYEDGPDMRRRKRSAFFRGI